MLKPTLKYLLPLILIALVSFNLSCKGISGSGVSESERFESGFRSLRIGQITTANNRVATTMAIDSRETIVVLEPAPGSPSLTEVLYQTTDASNNAEILVGSDSLPQLANTDDSNIAFSNYTSNSVTLDIRNAGVALPSQTVALNDGIFGFTDSGKNLSHTKALTEADLTRIFNIAIIAVRVFGCSSQAYLQSNTSSPTFGSLTDSACSSTLVTTMLNVIKVGDFDQRIVEGYIGAPVDCAYPDGSFPDSVNCLNNSTPEVVRESLISDPEIETVLDGTFDPNTGEVTPPTPEPTPTPTSTPDSNPEDPTPTATPDDSIPEVPVPPAPGDPVPE